MNVNCLILSQTSYLMISFIYGLLTSTNRSWNQNSLRSSLLLPSSHHLLIPLYKKQKIPKMVELILFMIAAVVALIIFDMYVAEHTASNTPSSSLDFEEEPRAERHFSNCSIFAVLGFTREEVRTFTAFRDHFRSYAEVTGAMRRAGLERMRLIVGIDFSASNEWQGRRTFKGILPLPLSSI